MSLTFLKNISSPIEQEMQKELQNYQEALKLDAEFHVLKSIKKRIKLLEAVLKEREKRSNRIGNEVAKSGA